LNASRTFGSLPGPSSVRSRITGNNDPIGPDYGTFFDSAIQNPGYDTAKACDLLKQAGYADGLSGLTLQTINVLGYDTLATVLQQQWSAACIKVDINVNEEWIAQPYGRFTLNEWKVALKGWRHFLELPRSLGSIVEIDL
jgi:ABC-type transport system substrate-binding protein